jgi:hypothetical protein
MAGTDDPDATSDAARTADAEQERLIADHQGRHGPLPARILGELRSAERHGGAAGARAAGAVGAAGARAAGAVGATGAKAAGSVESSAAALSLEVVRTDLAGPRALFGHVLGMRMLLPAEGVHGPRETAALLYLFRDALAIRPTDDAPMSAVPLFGLHLLMPHIAMARWVYKAGRTAHANLDLAREEREFAAALDQWTVDDFSDATPKLHVFPTGAVPGPVHLYEHLGSVHLVVPVLDGAPVRLKSALPESAEAYIRMWKLFDALTWPQGLTMEEPQSPHGPEEPAPNRPPDGSGAGPGAPGGG